MPQRRPAHGLSTSTLFRQSSCTNASIKSDCVWMLLTTSRRDAGQCMNFRLPFHFQEGSCRTIANLVCAWCPSSFVSLWLQHAAAPASAWALDSRFAGKTAAAQSPAQRLAAESAATKAHPSGRSAAAGHPGAAAHPGAAVQSGVGTCPGADAKGMKPAGALPDIIKQRLLQSVISIAFCLINSFPQQGIVLVLIESALRPRRSCQWQSCEGLGFRV